jgi:hypothetical protein
MKKYYVSSTRITSKIVETVMDTDSIKIGDLTYVRLTTKPKGRAILRTLHSTVSPEEQLIIYK